jgi:hypothetical protein
MVLKELLVVHIFTRVLWRIKWKCVHSKLKYIISFTAPSVCCISEHRHGADGQVLRFLNVHTTLPELESGCHPDSTEDYDIPCCWTVNFKGVSP